MKMAKVAAWAHNQDGVILVYSITSRESFNFIKAVSAEIMKSRTMLPLFLLIGNKGDCQERQVPQKDLYSLGFDLKCAFVEMSAKNDGAPAVAAAITGFVTQLRERRRSKGGNFDWIDSGMHL